MAHCPDCQIDPLSDIRDGDQCPQSSPMPMGFALPFFFSRHNQAAVSPHQASPTRPRSIDEVPRKISDKSEIYPEVISRIPELPLSGEPYTHNDVQFQIYPMDSLADEFADHWNQGNRMPLPGGSQGKGNYQKFNIYAPNSNAFLCSETLQYLSPRETPKPWLFVAGDNYTATLQADNETKTKAKIRWEQGTLKLESFAARSNVDSPTDMLDVEGIPVQLFIKPQRAALTREVCKSPEYFFYMHKGSGRLVALRLVAEQLLRRGSNFEALVKELATAMLNESILENLADAEKFEQRLLNLAGLPQDSASPPKLLVATEPECLVAVIEPEVQPPTLWADDEGEMNFNDVAWMGSNNAQ